MTDAMPDYSQSGVNLIEDSTPKADGFYFPAEWHPHDKTIMVLPSPQNWSGYGISMDKVRIQWADVANALAAFEDVLMVIRPEDRKAAKNIFSSEIELIEMPINDGWSRDIGPSFVIDGKGNRRVAGFTFNGWGAKFPPFDDDAMLKARLSKHFGADMYAIDFVTEGGALAVDGEGTCIATLSSLLNKNRNPGLDQATVEKILNDSLGTEKVIWLAKGVEPDPVTDGHVDGIAAFAAPGTVLVHTTDNRSDPSFKSSQDALRRLSEATDAKGRKLEVIEVPLDGVVSNLNFYIGNGVVLVPITEDPDQDERPMGVLEDVFGDRYEVIGVNAEVLGKGGGGVHCVTQQVPTAGA
ncbi:Agmatine deiminase [Rubripirellula tenax]|uniref:Agmatine deiminase n=1 Tax=Rubripirellula tenax TaxID=2528015 RepID=A0A5C6FET0_9BACT|nr:agmatine deiminase family protein [Rubripirellula tenax]TWU60011.1 Agmatine deiminase [Rubripirellula tenax]